MRARQMMPICAALLVASASACDLWPRLETRTFRVEHLNPASVNDLIGPYVYSDRAHWPGAMSVVQGAVTVRETRDNLARIERVLQEFDVAAPSLRLHFQLIEADGISGPPDPGIAGVVDELRRLFRFQGYGLIGEAVVTTGEGSVSQRIPTPSPREGVWTVNVERVSQPQPGSILLDGLMLWSETTRTAPLRTGLSLSIGQTVVIGSAATDDKTVILTVRADTSEEGRRDAERRDGERRE